MANSHLEALAFYSTSTKKSSKIAPLYEQKKRGALAQLARALAWHARGHRFKSDMLHQEKENLFKRTLFLC